MSSCETIKYDLTNGLNGTSLPLMFKIQAISSKAVIIIASQSSCFKRSRSLFTLVEYDSPEIDQSYVNKLSGKKQHETGINRSVSVPEYSTGRMKAWILLVGGLPIVHIESTRLMGVSERTILSAAEK